MLPCQVGVRPSLYGGKFRDGNNESSYPNVRHCSALQQRASGKGSSRPVLRIPCKAASVLIEAPRAQCPARSASYSYVRNRLTAQAERIIVRSFEVQASL